MGNGPWMGIASWRLHWWLEGVGPLRPGELLAVAAALGGLTAAAYGPHLSPGGFYNDDYAYLTAVLYGPEDTFLGAVRNLSWISFRPMMMPWWAFTFRVFGLDPSAHVAWTLLVGVLLATALYAVLRTLQLAPLHAGTIAALVLLLPIADSTRLWPSLSANVAAVALYLAGLVVALHAFQATGRRRLVLHALSVGAYATSLLLYEIAGTLILGSGLVYVLRAGRGGARRWAVDVGVTLGILLLVTSGTYYETPSIEAMIRHAGEIALQIPWALSETVWAAGDPGAIRQVIVVLSLGLVLVVGWIVLRRPHPNCAFAHVLRRWMMWAAGAAAATAVAYVMIIPSSLVSPASPGQLNRANVAGGLGLVVFVYATAMVGALLIVRRMGTWAITAPFLVVGAALVVGVGYMREVRADQRLWEAAAIEQRQIVEAIATVVPVPPADAAIVSFGAPLQTAPGIPVFAATWDLAGALTVRYDDPSLRAYPVGPDAKVRCGADRLELLDFGVTVHYADALLVDVPERKLLTVVDRATCRSAVERLQR